MSNCLQTTTEMEGSNPSGGVSQWQTLVDWGASMCECDYANAKQRGAEKTAYIAFYFFSECQHLFSIVLIEERSYAATCDRLEKRRTQRLFSEKFAFFVQRQQSPPVENL